MPVIQAACLGALVSLVLFAQTALAQEDPREHPKGSELLHLQFQSTAGCPGRDDFVAQVRARTDRAQFVGSPHAEERAAERRDATELRVRADIEGERAVGRFRLGKTSADRLVTGKTCSDVIAALALIAALAVDPAASFGTGRAVNGFAAAGSGEPPSESAGPDEAATAMPSNGAGARPPSGRRAGASTDTAETQPVAAAAPSRPWIGGAGARGELSRGLGSRAITMVGASVHVEAGLAIDAWWRPTVRLSAAFSQSPAVIPGDRPDTGAATFTLIAGRAAVCPLEFRRGESLVVRPCANLEIGRLEGSGSVIDNGSITTPRTGHALRLATGLSLLTRARLSGRVWFEMEAGATEPLVRQSFVFSNPDVTVRSTPFMEIALALGLGMYFP